MNRFLALLTMAYGFDSLTACVSSDDSTDAGATADAGAPSDAAFTSDADAMSDAEATSDSGVPSSTTVLDLDDLKTDPSGYEWFDFRPNVKKLILSGAAETEHVAILWYTTDDGGVGLHYHSKTESVYVIDGTQTDAKGVYPTGTVYYNPPGSGHEITHSTGFFLLAYAAPPDFAGTDMIEEYTPVRVDTDDPDLTSMYPFEEEEPGIRLFAPPLASEGGMSATFVEITSPGSLEHEGNYLLVLKGSCDIDGVTYGEDMLVVAKTVVPRLYRVAASEHSSCLVMGISF